MTTELMQLAEAWRTAANRLDNYRNRPDNGFNSTAVDFEYEALAGVAADALCSHVARLQAQVDALAVALRGLHTACTLALSDKTGKQFSYFETRAGTFVHAVEAMQGAESALAAADR